MECQCQFCIKKLPFDLPTEIIEAAISGELVIFTGAGISTETKDVFKETLYQDVMFDLKGSTNEHLDFPSAMSEYCRQKNGRKLLLEKIRNRFEYCQQFKELYRIATRFHDELSSLFFVKDIFTTNWDDYFERECNAIPIVTAEDFAFYNMDGRKVFKIHGSISNYGSIVATNEDYNRCYNNLKKGLVGSYLKTMLATKVVVFIGFSFSDFDFNKIYSYLKSEMRNVIPHCYIVTVDKTFEDKFSKEKATVINTEGSYFISIIREHLEGEGLLIPKHHIDIVYQYSFIRSDIHEESVDFFFKSKTTTTIYNLIYQDGLQHAFDFLTYHAKSGLTFNPDRILNSIEAYEQIKKELLREKNYPDYVYVEGYIVGLHSIFLGEIISSFPFYYILGHGFVDSIKQFKSLLKKKSVYHKTADRIGKKYFKDILNINSEVVPHHRPFI